MMEEKKQPNDMENMNSMPSDNSQVMPQPQGSIHKYKGLIIVIMVVIISLIVLLIALASNKQVDETVTEHFETTASPTVPPVENTQDLEMIEKELDISDLNQLDSQLEELDLDANSF